MTNEDDLTFAGSVQGQATRILSALVAGRADLAKERAIALLSHASARYNGLQMDTEAMSDGRFDLAGLTVDLDANRPERSTD